MLLAIVTPLNEILGVFIHCGPIETTLLDLCLCAKHTIMPFIWCCMTFLNEIPSVVGAHLHSSPSATNMAHPIDGVCFHMPASFCILLVVRTLKP
jgi:hypothetical protein